MLSRTFIRSSAAATSRMAPRALTLLPSRSMGKSALDERGHALEDQKVKEHDALLIAELAKHGAGVRNVSVIGAGLMGSGIAQIAASSGFDVTLIDNNKEALDKAMQSIQKNLGRVAKKKYAEEPLAAKEFEQKALDRLSHSTNLDSALSKADLAIEAIVENLDTKQALFKEMQEHANADTVFATNTSSFRVSDIGSSLSNPSRLGGLHFFNPVPVMPLVEVVRSSDTSDIAFDVLKHFCDTVGKRAVTCADTPGFVVNRLLIPYLSEAIRMVERGDSTLGDIDAAMKLGSGYPMGPFTLLDYVGLDTVLYALQGWSSGDANPMFEPPALLAKMVAAGCHGNKSGSGFYDNGKPNPKFFNENGSTL